MAVTQLYNRTTNLNGLIEYVMNGDKTDEMKYVSGVNCLPETAYEEMMSTKNRFNLCALYGLCACMSPWRYAGKRAQD